jgi:hypothetical protein
MKNLFVIALSLFSLQVFAHDHHTKNYCSQAAQPVCAHLGYNGEFTSEAAGEFVFHVVSAGADRMKDLTIDLWMDMGDGHGHGSAPVTITQFGPGKYKVSDAWFVMPGQWLVRSTFTIDGVAHEIAIPLNIQR